MDPLGTLSPRIPLDLGFSGKPPTTRLNRRDFPMGPRHEPFLDSGGVSSIACILQLCIVSL